MKKRISIILIVVLIISCFSFAIMSVTAEDYGIEYNFTNNSPANGSGTISLIADDTDLYSLYWGKDNNKLSDYSYLVQVNAKAGEKVSTDINKYTYIPKNVTQVLAYDSNNELKYSLDIPNNKINNFSEETYSVGIMSDIHFGKRDGVPIEYPNIAWNNATNFFTNNNVSLIVGSGDLTAAGLTTEFEDYSEKLNTFNQTYSKIPIYFTTGNHDCYRNQKGINEFVKYTSDSENYSGDIKREYFEDDKLDYTVTIDNDVYVFLSQVTSSYSLTSDIYTSEQLDWLENRLFQNKDKRVFLVAHTFVPGEAGDATNGLYRYGIDTSVIENSVAGPNSENASLKRFKQTINKYNNVTFFSGHSHFDFASQFLSRLNKTNYEVEDANYNLYTNIYRDDSLTTAATQVHVPSVSQPRVLRDKYDNESESSTEDYLLERTVVYDSEEQCYIMKVYDGCVVLEGYDIMSNKCIAFANYMIDTNTGDFGQSNYTTAQRYKTIVTQAEDCNYSGTPELRTITSYSKIGVYMPKQDEAQNKIEQGSSAKFTISDVPKGYYTLSFDHLSSASRSKFRITVNGKNFGIFDLAEQSDNSTTYSTMELGKVYVSKTHDLDIVFSVTEPVATGFIIDSFTLVKPLYFTPEYNTFYTTGSKVVNYGDLNEDGYVDVKDILLLKQNLANINTSLDKDAADCNNDGNIDLKDSMILIKHLAHCFVEFGK